MATKFILITYTQNIPTEISVRFEILTTVLIKIWAIYWDISLCKLIPTHTSDEPAVPILRTVKEEVNCVVFSKDGGSKLFNYTMNYLPIYMSTPLKERET